MILHRPWTLALGDHHPVPVTIEAESGITKHMITNEDLPLGLAPTSERHRAVRAVLTAPDGSRAHGVGSVDSVDFNRDRTRTFRASFTEFGGQ